MTRLETWLELERFDFSPLAGRWASVHMLGVLASELGAPAGAKLVIERGSTASSHGAFVSATDRRGETLLWLASFAVPLEVVQHPDALFELLAPGCPAIALPAPGTLVLPASARAQLRLARRFPHLHLGRRATAMATALALSASSVPATGLALARTSHGFVDRPAADQETLPSAQGHAVAHLALPDKPVIELSNFPSRRRVVSSGPDVASLPAPAMPELATPKPATPVPSTPKRNRDPARPQSFSAPASPRRAAKPDAPATSHAPDKAAAHTKTAHHTKAAQDPAHHHVRFSGGAPIIAPKPAPAPAPPPVAQLPTRPETENEGSEGGTGVIGTGTTGGSSQLTKIPPPALLARLYSNLAGPPPFLIAIYKQAQNRYHVPWQILAAINSVETNYGRDLSVSSAGAEGWMQFMPETWAQWGVDANHDGKKNPYDPRDAIFAAARYLRANGAPKDLHRAIFAYNHAEWYVTEVLQRAQWILDTYRVRVHGPSGKKIKRMTVMADLLIGRPYVWGGGHSGWQFEAGYDCSGFVSAVLHAGGYLSSPQTTDTLPGQPGIKSGPGRWVTIFDRTGGSGHVIIDLNGTFYESGGSAFGGGGAGVKKIQPPLEYLVTFNTILHPQGL